MLFNDVYTLFVIFIAFCCCVCYHLAKLHALSIIIDLKTYQPYVRFLLFFSTSKLKVTSQLEQQDHKISGGAVA